MPVATICSWFPPPRGLCPPARPGEAMGRGVHIHQSLCFSDGQVNVPVSRYLVPPRDKLPAGGVLQSSLLTYQGCWVCCRKPLQNDKSWEVTGGCQPTSKYTRWPLPGEGVHYKAHFAKNGEHIWSTTSFSAVSCIKIPLSGSPCPVSPSTHQLNLKWWLQSHPLPSGICPYSSA